MTIESLEIENFQRHETYRVDFDPQLTTIIGQTDAGKSSLLRALRWVALNLPDGDSFIRHGSNAAVATLRIDGHEIKRKRGTNGENTYYLDGQEYKAFGRGVPDAIAALLQVDKINFVGQKEPDFWFSLPPVEVARQLNAIVDLGVIDEALESIGRQVRQGQDAVKSAAERMTNSRTQRDSLEWVEQAEIDLENVEKAWAEVEQTQKQIENLSALIESIEDHERQRDAAATHADAIKKVGMAIGECLRTKEKISKLETIIAEIERLEKITSYKYDFQPLTDAFLQWQGTSGKIKRLTALITEIERLEAIAKRPIGDFAAVETAFNEMQRTADRASGLERLIADIEKGEELLAWRKEREQLARTDLVEYTQGRCPICGGEIPDHELCS